MLISSLVLAHTPILEYQPRTAVADHARIDLDQAAIVTQLASQVPNYSAAKAIHDEGVYSKPSAVCTFDAASLAALPDQINQSASVYFHTVGGRWVEGKAYTTYSKSTDLSSPSSEFVFTYVVENEPIEYEYGSGPVDPGDVCWVGSLPSSAQKTAGCVNGSTTGETSTVAIGTGANGASGCTLGSSGGFWTCESISAPLTATCTNQGKRSLKGFSTDAKKKMYDPTLSSSDCPPPDGSKGYVNGCPYTSYTPYWKYYCASASSPCYADGGYANVLVQAALAGDNSATALTHGGMNFTAMADAARVEVIQKGTAYLGAWMYAIREFEDAIDDCTAGSLTANAGSSGPVHAWDEGVAFYVGSAMSADDLSGDAVSTLDSKGFLAYSLANKRCRNFRTCGHSGDQTVGEAKVNLELWSLFKEGKDQIGVGNCGAAVPVKNAIVRKMTVPLIQGTLRYAWKLSDATPSANTPKERAEGAIFAAAVLPQVHACSPSAAQTVYANMNLNFEGNVDFTAVKRAFETCYPAMGITCAEVGGLWESGAYARAGSHDASPCVDPSAAPAPPIALLSYSPATVVTDHARIDLDQAAIVTQLASQVPNYSAAKAIHDEGVYSKPSAVCTFDAASLAALPEQINQSASVYFHTVGGRWVEGKAYATYSKSTDLSSPSSEFVFTYVVENEPIEYEYGSGPVDPGDVCWVGSLPSSAQKTAGCVDGSTTGETSTVAIGTGANGASGCTLGSSGGFWTCESISAPLTATCTNQGKRSLKGFSTDAKKKMYDPTLSSSDCPPPDGSKGYVNGCPYTSYTPYWKYYCASASSPCYADGGYANVLVQAALAGDNSATALTHGGMNFTAMADAARVEVIQKGTAYLGAWMYAIREFEDAIDDCTAGSLTANAGSSGPVHAWDEGVAFYVGSAMSADDLSGDAVSTLDSKGFLAYSLANKRCRNFRTCGHSGDQTVGEAKVNLELWSLFKEGKDQIGVGNCGAAVPVKNAIVRKMTVPLIQGTLRYAWKLSDATPSANTPKERAEGAIFAAAVLPQVHACSPSAAQTVYANMNLNFEGNVDFTAVKRAFETCYPAMGITCAEVGGLWESGAYARAGSHDASPCVDPSAAPAPPIALLSYSPATVVTDHARIDLDQAAIVTQLASQVPNYSAAKAIHDEGVYSKPSAVCTFDAASLAALPEQINQSASVYFHTVGGRWVEGKAYTTYSKSTDLSSPSSEFVFTYVVENEPIEYEYGSGPVDPGDVCWVGSLPSSAQKTAGCVDGSTTGETSTVAIGTGANGASGCTLGSSGGFWTCASISAPLTATCTNQGKRSLKGFSTDAKKKMYDPTLSSSDCPPPDGSKGYVNGCPYTSYTPYWKYYCASASSPCYADGGYANVLVQAALAGDSSATALTHGGMDFTAMADAARVEVIQKGTAYLGAWMYAIREFEDAIDDCTAGSLTANAGSSGPVHAWDEGVAFYVGSAMSADDLSGDAVSTLDSKGFLAYSLANKRCRNFRTCGHSGDQTVGEAKVNLELWTLFKEGKDQIGVGNCGAAVPVKNAIVRKMTVPLIQGTLRYAWKLSDATPSANTPKERAEGAIFAAAVLPQVHACSPSAAQTVYANMNLNFEGNVDFTAVKRAFETCYPAMGITCAEVGGLWESGAYARAGSHDASPCVDPSAAPAPPIALLSYSPATVVTDHARIDLDQAAIVTQLASQVPNYSAAKAIHDEGVYSKPSAVCTFDAASLAALPEQINQSASVYFHTVGGRWVEGKAYATYSKSTDLSSPSSEFVFTYVVENEPIEYEYGSGPVDPGDVCWVGSLPSSAQKTAGCVDGSTTGETSTVAIGTGANGASGCTLGSSGGFSTCASISAPLTATCTNQGKRSLKGFSTDAKKKMYDPTLSSSDCPPPDGSKGYVNGCPYTSYTPYWKYYCASASSPCYADGGYANVLVQAALAGDSSATALTHGGMDFTAMADAARVEVIQKGTAYLGAWMYAIREFEDAIDDCTAGSLTANAGSSGPVHAWDEGVAFYVGSAMSADDLSGDAVSTLDSKGFLAYSLANKRCRNFRTCGHSGDQTVGEAKVNLELWTLFKEGKDQVGVGNCGAAVPVKNAIVRKMTVPLIQGTLRYAWKLSDATPSANTPKERAEGAIFAAAVLPQVHACSPSAAQTVYANMNLNFEGNVDFTAVKRAFETCYPAMGITCAEVGGLWESGAYARAGSHDASPCVDPSAAPAPPIALLSYSPATVVTDHARIDLDQAAIVTQLASQVPNYSAAKAIHDEGVYSKPSAVCTFDAASLAALPEQINQSASVYFHTVGGRWVEGKAYATYSKSTDLSSPSSEFVFTYVVENEPIEYEYGSGPVDPGDVCWVGSLPSSAQKTAGCVDGSTTGETSTVAIGTGANGASGCTLGSSGGFSTCASISAQLTATCTNQGKRSLKGFSTDAKKKMYDPTLSSSDCPPPDGSKGYVNGCPYTSYTPYWKYYCASASSPCYADGGYANVLVQAALAGDSSATALTHGGMDFTAMADAARVEVIQKGTAYLGAWMYAIREFEDAIDDCTAGSLTANAGSSGPVHAWDEGVAFYVGSAMSADDLRGGAVSTLDSKGFLAYSLANKRCRNFRTCGHSGDQTVGEAKVNLELWSLFKEGKDQIGVGNCGAAVPVKNAIVRKMTVPLIQGTLRYAWKLSDATPSANTPKERAEGAIFAAAVLPQVHACSPSAAQTVYANMNLNFEGNVDFTAVKRAFETCYPAMGITCAEVGGLWESGAYARAGSHDASPCADAGPDGPAVIFAFLAGSASSFDLSAFKGRLSLLLSVSTDAILVSILPALDVSEAYVDVNVFTSTSAKADVLAALLTRTLSNTTEASTQLGVDIKQVTSLPAVSLPSSSSQLSDSAVAAIIGSVSVALVLALLLLFVICKETRGTPLFVSLDASPKSCHSVSATRVNGPHSESSV
ncbi:hypothetical protein AB1Y20_016539 [Prymnesium parvum]|uniref:Uncharacterized protein n=1 Tax=Prymnesium parvum TaxID=97485 RepID=A0AB34ICS9_PRYPA